MQLKPGLLHGLFFRGTTMTKKVFRHKNRLLSVLYIASGIALVFSLISIFDIFHGTRLQLEDKLFQAAALNNNPVPVEDIVIVAIDDKSLEQMGNLSSWPRIHQAKIIDKLASAGARVIAFDMLFSEPSLDDEALAKAMKSAGNVVLPFVHTVVPSGFGSNGQYISIENTIKPVDILEAGAAATGQAVVFPDADGIIRRLPVIMSNNDLYEPSLALAVVAEYLRRPQAVESPVEDGRLMFAGRSVPLDAVNCMYINYTADASNRLDFTEIPFIDVLQGEASPDLIRDKIVIIGSTATGISDKFWTPVGKMMNGVELHAAAMQTLLSGRFLRPVSPAMDVLIIFILVFLCSLAVMRFRVLWATLSAVCLCAVYFLVALLCFDKGLVLNLFHPSLAAVGAFVGMTVYSVVVERTEKMKITRTFGRYISPPVVDKILAAVKSDDLDLEGEPHEVTVLFADARRFTSIAENIQSHMVFRLLNTYLAVIIDNVLKYNGIVNKFGGDSILAVWNAPLKSENHALLAVRAAVDMQHDLHQLHQDDSHLLGAEFGIGINTGEAIVGNLGSRDRLEYTVIGDVVNVASRLAGVAPGGRIWLGIDTYVGVNDNIAARQLAPLKLKGRHESVLAYEIENIQERRVPDTGHFEKSGRVV
jgi:adenylate cyclase